MACSQTLAGIARDCSANMGGIKTVYIANKADVTSLTVTSGVVTAITMASHGTPPVTETFKEYYIRRNTGSLSSAYQVNNEAGTKFVQSTLAMTFVRLDTVKRLEITALAQAEAVAIVEDCNGKYWFLGKDEPLEIAQDTQALTGTDRADLNGYNVTLLDNSRELPLEVDANIIAGLL